MENEEIEISLQDITKVLKKRWKLIIIPAILAAIITALIGFFSHKTYESYAILKIGYSGSKSIESIPELNVIMQSLPMLKEIAGKLDVADLDIADNDEDFALSLKKTLFYQDSSGLLQISASASTPQKAQKKIQVVMDIIVDRHKLLYEASEKRINKAVRYVKETISPVPLSSGINEFISELTCVEVSPVLLVKPVPRKIKNKVVTVFIIVLFLSIVGSFYLEGKENRK